MGCFMKHGTRIWLFAVIFLLCACQYTPPFVFTPAKPINNIYLDSVFVGLLDEKVETEQDVFSLDDEMKKMVRAKLLREGNIRKRASRLLEHIFEAENVNLQYQGGANLTARQAYHSAQANCMSLTIMAYALAKYANLNVGFQSVQIPEYWQRNGNYNMLTGHVNLVIKKRDEANKVVLMSNDVLEIDFDPYVNKKSFPKKVINKSTILAMFYNNKGAQALASKDFVTAYRYFKSATLTADDFSSAWGNLGVLYKKLGYDEHAAFAYHKAISLNANNNTAMNNLAILLRSNGELDLAEEIELAILRKRINNPYYYALLGDEALRRGDIDHAMSHYRKAINLDGTVDEFYLGLAKVYYANNNFGAAKSALKKAMSLNKVKQIDNQYLAKLNFLKRAQ